MVKISTTEFDADTLQAFQATGTKGVIYELPADETYQVETPTISDKIANLVIRFKASNINVILDITPNFVTKDDELYKKIKEDEVNDTDLEPFVVANSEAVPNNWLSTVEGSAWFEYNPKQYILSQFGTDRFDLRLNTTLAKNKFKGVIRHLAKLGVKGFRLHNSKHLIISKSLANEEPVQKIGAVHTDYDYWTHTQTTYQNGLGDLLLEFGTLIKNVTNNEGFLSVTEPIKLPEVFIASDKKLAIELPIYGLLPYTLARNAPNVTSRLKEELTQIVKILGSKTWVQWQYDVGTLKTSNIGSSEYNTFLLLLPGVPVSVLESFKDGNDTTYIRRLEQIRESPSYMHGSFQVYTDANDTVIAYSR